MNRRGLFTLAGVLGALGLAKAQSTIQDALGNPAKGTEFYVDNRCVGVSNGDGTLSPCKPKNGQCPVCGTMAPKYTGQRRQKMVSCPEPNASPYVVCMKDEGLYDGQVQITRCARCNAAFFQDAK